MSPKMKGNLKMRGIRRKIKNQRREKISLKRRNNPQDKDNYLLSKFKVFWMR